MGRGAMTEFIEWLLSDRTYVDLLFFSAIMVLLVVANLLEQRNEDRSGIKGVSAGELSDREEH